MKKLAALFVAAVCSATLAQMPQKQAPPNLPWVRPSPMRPVVMPAEKPVLLHTGKPLTTDQKMQLLQSAIQVHKAKSATATNDVRRKEVQPASAPAPAASAVIYPNAMGAQTDTMYAYATQPQVVNPATGVMEFNAGANSSMTFVVNSQPNTAYLL